MKLQFWFTDADRDLLRTALGYLESNCLTEIPMGNNPMCLRTAGAITNRRLREMLIRLQEPKGKP